MESPESRGSWASHGVPGCFYLGPAVLHHYRSHHVFVTASSATRLTDTVAWFPETNITPPLPDTNEILIAEIKDLLHAIKNYNLNGEIIPLSLAQEMQDLANLHSAPPIDSPPASEIGTEKRGVISIDNIVQGESVVLPSYIGLSKPSSHCSCGPATAPSNPNNYLPPAAQLITSSRNGSPKLSHGTICLSTDSASRSNSSYHVGTSYAYPVPSATLP